MKVDEILKWVPPFTVEHGSLREETETDDEYATRNTRDELWVKDEDSTYETARAIRARVLSGERWVDVAVMGAPAVNQGMKGIAAARKMVMESGRDLFAIPYWSTFIDDAGEEKVRLIIRCFVVEQ